VRADAFADSSGLQEFADDVIRANLRVGQQGFVKPAEHCPDAESRNIIRDCRPQRLAYWQPVQKHR